MNAIDMLARDNWIILNGTLADNLGIETAILVGLLSSYQRSFGGEFYRERAQIIKESHLSDYAFRKACEKLKDLGILEISYRGVPCRCYYKLDNEKLALQFVDGQQSSFDDFNKSRFDDFDTPINNKNNPYNEEIEKSRDNINNNNKHTAGVEIDGIDVMFNKFWELYPKKVAKKTAYTAFKNVKGLKKEFDSIIMAVNMKKGSSQWTREGGRYVPNPATFLHQERWKDEEQHMNMTDEILSSDNDYFNDNVRAMLKEMGR